MSWLVDNPEILRGYRRGERWALEAVYHHYVSDLRRFVSCGFSFESGGRRCRFRGLENPLDVDDVLQEVFVRALSESVRLRYDGLRPFRNYLLTIARNLVLQNVGRMMRLVSLDLDRQQPQPEAELAGEPCASPEQAALDRQLVELVGRFVDSLSHHDRRFYQIRFADQRTQDETARRMRLTRAKVKTHERRIRGRFIRFMQQHGWSFDCAAARASLRHCAPTTVLLIVSIISGGGR